MSGRELPCQGQQAMLLYKAAMHRGLGAGDAWYHPLWQSSVSSCCAPMLVPVSAWMLLVPGSGLGERPALPPGWEGGRGWGKDLVSDLYPPTCAVQCPAASGLGCSAV